MGKGRLLGQETARNLSPETETGLSKVSLSVCVSHGVLFLLCREERKKSHSGIVIGYFFSFLSFFSLPFLNYLD